jgi:ABC-type ATPase involved in cell division
MQDAAAPSRTADTGGAALFYLPSAHAGGEGRLWVHAGGEHRIRAADKPELLAAVFEMQLQPGARLVLLGVEIGALHDRERQALRERVAYLPADGGLLSSLNAWENIILPLAFHRPREMRGVGARVHALLKEFGIEPRSFLARLPETMSLYEKKLTGFIRLLIEAPDLLLADRLSAGLDAAESERTARFAAIYFAACPGGTFVHLDDASGD